MPWTYSIGGSPLQPADVSFLAYTMAADLTLTWPSSNTDTANVVARQMDITASVASLNLIMPSATQVSTGMDASIRNIGSNTFTVQDSAGGTIVSIAAGVTAYIYLKTNATAAGTWGTYTLGTGTSAADASALAGAGLSAMASVLNFVMPVDAHAANYTVIAGDRARLMNWTGGAGTFTLTSAATLGASFVVAISNQGTGTLTVGSASNIDGTATITLNPTESCWAMSNGSTWVTVGRGRSVVTTVSSLSKVLASGTAVLSTTEAAAQVQTFSGALSTAVTVRYGSTSNYYFVNNTATGFNVTFQGSAIDPGVVVASGTKNVLVNNSGTMVAAISLTSGTVTNVATGTGLTGGPITTTGTLALASTAVTPGAYDLPTALTIDAQGRITSATSSFASTDVERLSQNQTVTGTRTYSAAQIFSALVTLNAAAAFNGAANFTAPITVTNTSAAGIVTVLTDGSTVPVDLSTGNNFILTLTGTPHVLNSPTNPTVGQCGAIRIVQDATGSRVLTYGANWKFSGGTAPTLTTTALAVDILTYYVDSLTSVSASLLSDMR